MYYIGYKHGAQEVFKSSRKPTQATHPQYNAVWGGFRTKEGAEYALYNPFPFLTCESACRIARQVRVSSKHQREGR